jgi:hypothetical protein
MSGWTTHAVNFGMLAQALFSQCLDLGYPALIVEVMTLHVENYAVQSKAADAMG